MHDWLRMGGYAQYVWGAYGIAFIVFAGNMLFTRLQKRKTHRAIRRYLTKQAYHASNS